MREIFSNITSDISFLDIIDILAVSFIAYLILGFIKDTRAKQLVKGIIAIVVVFILSGLIGLQTLNWLLKNVMTIGAIALVVLFQPELRRVLEYMGRGSFLSSRFSGDKNRVKDVIDAIVDSCSYFSETRTGALIVIEGEVSLGEIAENGTVLDADVTETLLKNIFYKGSPLHDGAAIVRDDRIHAAGCVLPLTSRIDIDKDLGTRHRAALGITENSDAITIVVSEENGIISVARGDKLTRFLDSKGLEKLLLNIYFDEEKEESGIFSFLKKSVGGSNDAEQ